MSEQQRAQAAFEARVRAFVGLREGPPWSCPDAVNEAMIRHWCEVLGDANPVYTDPERAVRSAHGGLVAPPTMLQTWDMRGYPMHDPRLIRNRQRELHALFDEAGYTGVVATDTQQEYARYLRPGDRITSETTIESISEEKVTALGVGYFIATRTVFRDEGRQEVGRIDFRVLKFKPSRPAAAVASPAAPAAPARIASPRGPDNAWWWEGCDAGVLLIQKCSGCGALRHPPRPMCGRCLSTGWESVRASGRGRVHSYTVLHHPRVPGYEMPLPVALVELEEGTRLVANLKGVAPDGISIGMAVECRFEDLSGSMRLPFFHPAT